MKHTPGPWKIKRYRNAAPEIIGVGWMGKRRIAKVLYEGGSEDPEVHANAKLIAVAPEMLKELEDLREEFEGLRSIAKKSSKPIRFQESALEKYVIELDEIIAKAKGSD